MTTTLALQKLLREQGLAGLEPFAIRVRRHGTHANLVCFKYDQRLSPMTELAVQEARGIILDEAQDWKVTSMSYKKFFNLEEQLAAPIDWASARVEEKLDGSLMSLYWYDHAWQVQSSGTADAAGTVFQDIRQRHQELTYRQLFWDTWAELGYQLPPPPQELGAAYTFAFELMTEHNRVVVRHSKPALVLHGVRNLETLLEEAAEDWAARLGYPSVKTFNLSREGLRGAASEISPLEGEGFIVRDAQFNRVKIKSEAYIWVSLLRESWSEKRALELVLQGEQSEILTYFPEYNSRLEDVEKRVKRVTDALDQDYALIKHIENQKEFAAEATKNKNSAALFSLRLGKFPDAYAWLLSLGETPRLRALANAGEVFTS